MINYAVRSHRGCIREKNEDRFFIPRKEQPLVFAVADGMGGHAAGEVASAMCIEALGEKVEELSEKLQQYDLFKMKDILEQAMLQANESVYYAQNKSPEFKGMGTTLTVAVLLDKEILVGHVGDSQVHLFSEEGCFQVTEDHSLVMELLKNGEISPEEIHTHPQRHFLTRVLGASPSVKIDFYIAALAPGHFILLCTDGLTTMLKPEEIRQIIYSATDIEEAADRLLEESNTLGGLDNITFVLVNINIG